MYLFSTDSPSIRSHFLYRRSLKPQIALQSIQLQVSKVQHISSSPSHQIIWIQQHLLLFVSGMTIVEYNALANKFKILQRNPLQEQIIIFKGLQKQLSHTTVGYITKKQGGRYDFLYRNLSHWVLVSTFKLLKGESICHIMMFSFNCFGVVIKRDESKGKGKKLVIFREDIEVEYQKEREDDLLFVFPSEKGSLIVVNKYSVQKIVFDTLMLGDVKVMCSVSVELLEDGVMWAQKIQEHILLFGQRKILILNKQLDIKQLAMPIEITQILRIKTMDNYIFIQQHSKITRLLFQEIDMFGKQTQYQLSNPTYLQFQNIQNFVISSNCNTLIIKKKLSSKIFLVNIESYKLTLSVPQNFFQNYISLEFQSKFSISSLHQNPVRTPEIFYIKNFKLYQNNIDILDEVLCYSLSSNGLYLLAGFQYYLKGYYVGKNKLFLIESIPILNILDIRFYQGNKYIVITKQQIRVYSGIPTELIHTWSLNNSNKYLSFNLYKNNQIIVYDALGSFTMYSLTNFQKIKQVKLPKINFIMYDHASNIIFNYSKIKSKIELYHLQLQQSVALEYQDKDIPINAVVVQNGGFIIISTNKGNLRIHKWPPEKQFINNYIEFKVFADSISSLEFDALNSVIYVGSESGNLLNVKMVYQNLDTKYYRGILTGLYIESKRNTNDLQLEIEKLEQALEISKVKYNEEVKLGKERLDEWTRKGGIQLDQGFNNQLEAARKQISSKLHEVKVKLHTLPQIHQQNKDRIRKEANDIEIKARQIGQAKKQTIFQLSQKHKQNMAILNQLLEKDKLADRVSKSRKIKHRYYKSQGNIAKIIKPVPLFQQINNQIQQDDENHWKIIESNQLQRLNNQFCNELNYNSKLKSNQFNLFSKIDNLKERIFQIFELNETMSIKLKVDIKDQQAMKHILEQKLDKLDLKEHLDSKNLVMKALKREGDRADESSKKLENLENQYELVLKEQNAEINKRYYQLLDQLKQQFQNKVSVQKQIQEKNSKLKKLKEQMKRKLRKRIQTQYQIQSFQTEIINAKTNLQPKRGQRKVKIIQNQNIQQTHVRHNSIAHTQFYGNATEFQRSNLSKIMKNKCKAIGIRMKENQNLIFESHRLKKETTNSEIYLRYLKGGLTPSDVERIESKKKYVNKELKLTPFQVYHQQKKSVQTYTCSSPISRKMSVRKRGKDGAK